MAASVWRMNGLWRTMAGALVLCALFFSNEVICQDVVTSDAIAISTVDPAALNVPALTTNSPNPDAILTTGAGGKDFPPSAAPGVNPLPATIMYITPNADSKDGDVPGTSAATTGSVAGGGVVASASSAPDEVHTPKKELVLTCLEEKNITESKAVKFVASTNSCEATKEILLNNAASWCPNNNCNLEIFQDGNTVLVASKDVKLGVFAEALRSEALKKKLGVTNIETPPTSGSSVFVGILVTGLLAAIGITVGYFKCQRKSDTKEVRLAEEAYPGDQENQGNTLLSVVPLNPLSETQEKPSVNGESPEAAKTQPPPPTNGHSTPAKTADTEL